MMRPCCALSRPAVKDVPVKVVRSSLAPIALFFFLFVAAAGIASENWPQWRGPTANGISDSKNLPTTWNAERGENIVWKTALPAWSGSTPIIWGDHVFLTSPSKSDGSVPSAPPGPGGKRANRDPGGQTLLLLCLS